MIQRKINHIVLFIFVISALIGCDRNRLFENHEAISDKGWHQNDVISISSTELKDTEAVYHCLLAIRHQTTYPYSNVYVRIKTIYPSGKEVLLDLPSIDLQDKNGYWFGKGSGDERDMRIYFKRNVQFNEEGVYQFQVQHRMRDEVLRGINDIGIRIEFAK